MDFIFILGTQSRYMVIYIQTEEISDKIKSVMLSFNLGKNGQNLSWHRVLRYKIWYSVGVVQRSAKHMLHKTTLMISCREYASSINLVQYE